jgi:hypothetical protein
MPIKRRITKGREIDDLKLGELVEGPGSCLCAGAGYYLPHQGPGALAGNPGGFFWDVSKTGQAHLLDLMRADWDRVGARLMADHDDPQAIWSFRKFGPPEGWADNHERQSNDR